MEERDTENNLQDTVQEGVHNFSGEEAYVPPTDPLVKKKLEWFRDQKLALMMHWGPYSQLGLVESWALSDADGDWSRHDVDWTDDYEQLKDEYFALNRTFNPIRFQPEKWAEIGAENGFRYLIFTTKHHDGFCMWDTAFTSYKITAQSCAFSGHPKADIVKHVFDAFRRKGLGIAAYFSKADWHTPYYWNPDLRVGRLSSRGPSYDPAERPELWEGFCRFTKNQIIELCENYGPLDILWFDAGWVHAGNGQDIRLGEIVEEARRLQPGLLSADRTVGGPYENYVTPEQCIPETALPMPWESCITVGTQFSFKYGDTYKTPRELVCLLAEVVAKNGNLALNIGPQPDGQLPRQAVRSLEGLGSWLKVNGEAIYGTRPLAPYMAENLAFTRKEGKKYAIRLYPDPNAVPEKEIILPFAHEGRVTLLETGEEFPCRMSGEGVRVRLPEARPGEALPLARVFVLDGNGTAE